ncbi:MAG TPA: peptidylprolyl isomerase, partial [Blastocatellia bacterium]|nr:peptidylprolyl isomerase [Blastocatellia bacterium]
ARKAGIHEERAIELKVLLEKSQALARAYVNDLQKNPQKLVSDADVEQYYKEHPEEFDEVHARHILISTRAEEDDAGAPDAPTKKAKPLTKDEARKKAQSILDRVRNGEDFNKLAEEHSDDPSSKPKGGDLGFFAKGAMVPQFDSAAFSMKPGEISDLIETEFGFHIIKVEERRTKSLDDPQAKQQITEKVQQDKLQKHIEEIAARSKVEVAEDFAVNPKAAPQLELPPAAGAVPEGAPPTN